MQEILLIIFSLGALVAIVFLLLQLVYFSSALFVWPPSIPTDYRTRKKILEILNGKFPIETSMKIVDMGSGYGHLVKNLSKYFKKSQVTGVELLFLPYLVSKIKFSYSNNVQITKGDIYKHSISGYDAVIFFLRKNHKMDEKIKQEISKGAVVISNNFPLKDYKPNEIHEVKDIIGSRKIYLYQF